MTPLAPRSPLFPYTTLFRSRWAGSYSAACTMQVQPAAIWAVVGGQTAAGLVAAPPPSGVSVALAGISRFTLPGRFPPASRVRVPLLGTPTGPRPTPLP